MTGIQPQNYETIRSQLKGLLESDMPWESALTSLIALLKEHHALVSWVGFYRNHDGHLWVGPYQGRLACLHLAPGQGVCGRALEQRRPLIVDDVGAFPGHVACDPLSRSEIVVPVFRRRRRRPTASDARELVGVLDLDSHVPAAFDATDQKELEDCLKAIEPLPDEMP